MRPAELDNAAVQELIDVGGPELFATLVDDFAPFAISTVETISDGATAGDCAVVQAASHSMKSASATLGAGELSAIAAHLESLSKGQDIAAVRKLLPEFEQAVDAAQIALIAGSGR
ncbi:MAG: Hpt domain-containing protein [Candidatus Nanopelagicales bacterium]|nr:Hpt domain-containing protein [Candidatus Nanopelagicales bacterium]